MKQYLITVFTPTYNRAHLLPRLFQSLKQQTITDFEWIIVDDESSDETEITVQKFLEERTTFPIRYFKQKHGGKHRAVNLGVKEAQGSFFYIVDSDDWLPENALALLQKWLKEIEGIPKLCGVAGQKASPDGSVVGESFTGGRSVDASSLERKKLYIQGDKAEVFRTDVLRKHPFPEFGGEFFVTENVCWNAIAADGYQLRWYQDPIYYCEYLEDGLSRSGANDLSGHIKNFQGYCYYIRQCLEVKNRLDSYRDFVDFQKTCDAMDLSEAERANALHISKCQFRVCKLLTMPIIHNVKRAIYVGGRIKSLVYNTR